MGALGVIEVIPNGVDFGLFKKEYSHPEIESVQKELGLSDQDKVLITTSRLVKKNAVGDIITSLTHLSENIKLLVIGIGPLESELKAQAKDLGLETRIIFAGLKKYEDIPKYLATSDIFIRPSLSEGMGNSFIEAMAAGVPVIATPVGGIPDFLKEGETGLFCEVQNPQSIAEKVQMILDNPELNADLVKKAQKFIEGKYEWNTVAVDMKDKIFSQI
jgi:glycosyltransferase involved in cell wall biosynthesis